MVDVRALVLLALVACGGDMAILLIGPPPPPVEPEPVNRLLVIVAQSNGTDTSIAADITIVDGLEVPDPRWQIIDHNAPTPADPPVFVDEGPRDGSPRTVQISATFPVGSGGMACLMGRKLMDETIDSWTIAKFTISGAGLVAHLNNAAYPTVGPKIPAQIVTFIEAQALAFGVTDLENNLIVLFNQGETDATNAVTHAAYLASIDDFFTTLRAALGNFRVFIQRLSTRFLVSNECTHPMRTRTAQESFASTSPRTYVVPTDTATFRDPSHYSDDGAGGIGVDTVDAIIEVLYGEPPDGPWYVASAPVIESADSASGITVALPRHFAGDVFLVGVSALGNVDYTIDAPGTGGNVSGFVEADNSPQHDGGDPLNARLHVFWARADQTIMDANGGQMPSLVIPDIGGDDIKIGAPMLFRDCVASGDPFDATAGDTAPTSTGVEIPGGETTGPDRLIVALAAIRVDSGTPQFSAWANADLADVTQQVSYSTATTVGYGFGVATGRKAAAGPYGVFTAEIATTSTQALWSGALK